MRKIAIILAVTGIYLLAAILTGAQAPLDQGGTSMRSHLALQALDRYLETWNTRDATRWAGSLHFPHVRADAGNFPLHKTREEYIASVDFAKTLAGGWRYTQWDKPRRVLQVGIDKVHVTGLWRRYLEGGGTQNQNYVTYIITREGERWGIRARFGAGRPIADAKVATRNSAAALKGLNVFIQAWNSHNPEAVAAAIHYPHVRIADGELQYWATSREFLAGTEPGRQRTWAETRIESAKVEQVADRGANIAVTYSLRSRDGEILSKYEAVYLITQRDDGWKVQGCSSMGS